jgi:hypothetical protein
VRLVTAPSEQDAFGRFDTTSIAMTTELVPVERRFRSNCLCAGGRRCSDRASGQGSGTDGSRTSTMADSRALSAVDWCREPHVLLRSDRGRHSRGVGVGGGCRMSAPNDGLAFDLAAPDRHGGTGQARAGAPPSSSSSPDGAAESCRPGPTGRGELTIASGRNDASPHTPEGRPSRSGLGAPDIAAAEPVRVGIRHAVDAS